MIPKRRMALLLILCCCGVSVLWGSFVARSSAGGLTDFKAVYYGTRCLLEHADPYKNADFLRIYRANGQQIPTEPMMAELFRRAVLVCVNLPTTLFLILPFALLPLGSAYVLWALLMIAGLCVASFLMWDLTVKTSSRLPLALVCFLVANCVILFADGNTACIVICLCVAAVWCFLQDRFVPAGIVCMALSLAIKPHDAGLVWLYFLLAGGIYRRRALQTLAVTVALCIPAVVWITHLVPHWLPELWGNMQLASARGGLNDPGPAAIGFHHPDPIISLQALLSVFRDDPHFYVPVSLLVSGILLLLWCFTTLRSRFTQRGAWLALASMAALTMLVTYHRQHDAKLLLLTVPACALLWSERGLIGWFAMLANSAAIVVTGDIPATGLTILTAHLPVGMGFFEHLKAAVLIRPEPIVLLALAIFYLWVYMRYPGANGASGTDAEDSGAGPVFDEGGPGQPAAAIAE